MIDSSMFSASPWNSSSNLCKEVFPYLEDFSEDLCLNGFNDDFLKDEASLSGTDRFDGDEPSIESDFEFLSPLWEEGQNGSCIINLLDLEKSEDECQKRNVLAHQEEESTSEWQYLNRRTVKRSRSQETVHSGKSWSHMSSKEQLETVEALTEIISCQMGLREQLDVIHIIDPQAEVSSNDSEFVVDLAHLDDTKLQQIRSYVKKHSLDLNECLRSEGSSRNSSSTSASFSSESSTSGKSQSSTRLKRRLSKKEAKARRNEMKYWKQRQKKEQKQLKKEKKSGLFLHEEVMTINNKVPPLKEDDINIVD